MKIQVVSLAVAALISVAAVRVPEMSESALKCRSTPLPRVVVYVLDAKIVDQAVLKSIDPKTIESVEVICSDARHRVFGVEAGQDLILIFTKPGPASAVKASLDSIASRQRTHLAKHGVFAADLAALPWSDPSGLITVKLVVSENGNRWSATGSHRYVSGESSVSGARTPP